MRSSTVATIVWCIFCPLISATDADDDNERRQLQGVWLAQSMESEGKAAPKFIVERMRFTFRGDKLFVKGNFRDGREEECTFRVDPSKSPKHLDFTPPKKQSPVLCIYDVDGDQLKICFRHARSDAGRPTEFATKAESQLVMIVFKKKG